MPGLSAMRHAFPQPQSCAPTHTAAFSLQSDAVQEPALGCGLQTPWTHSPPFAQSESAKQHPAFAGTQTPA
jgi:hypothetical protein